MPPPNHCLCSPNENCAPQSQDCAPKIVTGSQPLEYSSRPETPKILTINPKSVSKDRFFADSVVKTIFFVFTLELEETKFFCPPKIVYAPPPLPPPVMPLWRRVNKVCQLGQDVCSAGNTFEKIAEGCR